jgi:putative PIN family toxin of toxin-antitoxin system
MRNEHDGGKYRRTGLSVVLDTNVYVSIFNYSGSLTAQVWRHALKRDYRIFISPVIVEEFARICRRDFDWDEKRVRLHVRLLNKTGKVVVPGSIPDVIKEDPDDNHILACALAGKANLIVSKDLDLLRRKSYEGIGIVTPIDFLHMLEGEE